MIFERPILKAIRPLTLRMHYRNPFFLAWLGKKWAFWLVITRGKCQQVLFVLTHYLLLLVNALLFWWSQPRRIFLYILKLHLWKCLCPFFKGSSEKRSLTLASAVWVQRVLGTTPWLTTFPFISMILQRLSKPVTLTVFLYSSVQVSFEDLAAHS